MRIALFHNLPSGGAKRVVFEFVKHLIEEHEIDLYIYDQNAEDFLDIRPLVNNTIHIDGGNAISMGGLGRFISINRVRNASKKTAQLMNDGNYDIALVMQCKVTNSPYVLRYLNIPSLYFCHEPSAKIMEPHYRGLEQDGRLQILKKLFLKWGIAIDRSNAISATQICTSSLYSRENLYRNYGIYPRLNYLGVDADFFQPLDLHREPMVLCVGALNSAKGQDFVIKSVGTLNQKPIVKFIYNFAYGVTTYKERLVELADKLGVSITFECLVSDSDLVTAYNQATLTVFPSLLEPLGLVPLESMACGTPVVGIAEAGVRETVLNNKTGLLTERDEHEFGEAINQLINEKEIWSRMSLMGRNWVQERWSWEQAVKQLKKNIEKTIERHAHLRNNKNLP